MSYENCALSLVPGFAPEVRPEAPHEPTLEDTICYLRWAYPEMIETLDQRMERQKAMVDRLLRDRGIDPDELVERTPSEVPDDEIVRFCYHVLRDIEYIDGLRC